MTISPSSTTQPVTEFVKPNGKPDDKAWLYDQVLSLITSPGRFDTSVRPKSEREIYAALAPISGSRFPDTRPSWDAKPRKVKRDMLAAALRRLAADGKTQVEFRTQNRKSQHGMEVRRRKEEPHLFGKQHDGLVRYYSETNVLQAIVDALEASE